MLKRIAWKAGALTGASAVVLGAFGAHALKERLTLAGTLHTWETAVFYHFIHALLLCVLGFDIDRWRGPWVCCFTGIVLFSGSLYLLALTGIGLLGAVTPFGGVLFIAGWIWIAFRPPAGFGQVKGESPQSSW